ncbi:MAG: D-alanyl-D-alanine carboxypeptidase family protein [Acutalibacteraceae bacterium]|jgi:D-alanyl-D-alanine carboxypeptidase (penicillin-binding protein 5/6)
MKTGIKSISTTILALVFISSMTIFVSAEEMPVQVNAKSAVLMDCSTGKVLMSMNENEKLYPASVTKIMSMLLVTEAIDSGKIALSDTVTASPDATAKGGSQIWLKEGETMTVDDLLKATAIGSANDACTALADHIAGSEAGFVVMMNDRAKELGMENTFFENCTGLDDTTENHLTTAYDIALMSRELINHERITNYTTVWMDTLRGGETELVNTNKLVRFYQGTTGLKTGTTSKAGHCLSATAKRGETHLIAVILGSDNSKDRFEGAKAMLNWGFANYTTIQPEIDMSLITNVNVLHGTQKTITPKIPKSENVLVKANKKGEIKQKVNLAVDVEAPIEKGQVLGTVDFSVDDEMIAQYNLTAEYGVERLSFGDALRRLFTSLGNQDELSKNIHN